MIGLILYLHILHQICPLPWIQPSLTLSLFLDHPVYMRASMRDPQWVWPQCSCLELFWLAIEKWREIYSCSVRKQKVEKFWRFPGLSAKYLSKLFFMAENPCSTVGNGPPKSVFKFYIFLVKFGKNSKTLNNFSQKFITFQVFSLKYHPLKIRLFSFHFKMIEFMKQKG